MKRPVSIAIASLALSLLAIGGIASCKQGEGERCQVTEDCEEGLQCNLSQSGGVCQELATGEIDALLPEDAPPDTM